MRDFKSPDHPITRWLQPRQGRQTVAPGVSPGKARRETPSRGSPKRSAGDPRDAPAPSVFLSHPSHRTRRMGHPQGSGEGWATRLTLGCAKDGAPGDTRFIRTLGTMQRPVLRVKTPTSVERHFLEGTISISLNSRDSEPRRWVHIDASTTRDDVLKLNLRRPHDKSL